MTATAQTQPSSTIDAEDVARFSAQAELWWDAKGPFAPLHEINPVRMRYIRRHLIAHFSRSGEAIRPFEGLRFLDVGCGGGLVAEPLSRMGADVTGIDASEKNIGTARAHASQGGLAIDYRHTAAEALAAEGTQYDAVMALEIVEHVADLPLFLDALSRLVRPGGMLVLSTLNRTVKSLLLAKIGAEYILRWLPIGTHDWNQFLKPHELVQPLESHGLRLSDMQGLTLDPFRREWRMNPRDLDVNYMAVFTK